MQIASTTLAGQHVRLEPLSLADSEPLIDAASDGELWNSTVTIISDRAGMAAYIEEALQDQARHETLPFAIIRKAISEAGTTGAGAPPPGRHSDVPARVVGTTRFCDIRPADRRVAIGYTWLALSAQRTVINTESKLLLLTHAFEHWPCNRVELITDVLNQQSRAAILRLGAKQEGILRSFSILISMRRTRAGFRAMKCFPKAPCSSACAAPIRRIASDHSRDRRSRKRQ